MKKKQFYTLLQNKNIIYIKCWLDVMSPKTCKCYKIDNCCPFARPILHKLA